MAILGLMYMQKMGKLQVGRIKNYFMKPEHLCIPVNYTKTIAKQKIFTPCKRANNKGWASWHKFKTKPTEKEIKFTSNTGYYELYPSFSFAKYIQSDEYFSQEHSNERRN